MKPGDKVKIINVKTSYVNTHGECYTILEVGDTWIKLKHPTINGYFVLSKDYISEVIDEVSS